ncbi:hypothetical protein ACGFYV_37010 [Streptomyces sp. NPDC048297]|uniref:hypothetical protein n=1 Tax=Streptomyces sp. NPDC048297 TaxID=3365531 RepID=UPI003713A0CC
MICTRCDQPIGPDERYVTVHHFAPTGPGTTATVHEERCRPIPQQTCPVRPAARPRRRG